MDWDLTSLEVFLAVAHSSSVTLAAQQLDRAPSNVSTRVQQLEAALGASLFEREGKRLRLSERGALFVGYAQRILGLAAEAQQMLHPHHPQGLMRLGSMESTAATRLPPVLADFHRRWPSVKIALRTGPSQPLLQAVAACSLDAACIALLPPGGERARTRTQVQTQGLSQLNDQGLQGVPVFEESLELVLPASHANARQPQQLLGLSLASFASGCTYRQLALNWLREGPQGLRQIDVQEMGSYHAMLACVCAGASLSVLPRSVLDMSPQAKDLPRLPLARLPTWLVWRQGGATPNVQALLAMLQGNAKVKPMP